MGINPPLGLKIAQTEQPRVFGRVAQLGKAHKMIDTEEACKESWRPNRIGDEGLGKSERKTEHELEINK